MKYIIALIAAFFCWQVCRPGNFKAQPEYEGAISISDNKLIGKWDAGGADVAHVVERMTCNHQAAGSTPAIGSATDRMSSISQKCPTATTEIIMAAFKYGKRYGIEPELLLAIAYVESSFIPTRRSKSSIGLMGVNYGVWRKALSLDFARLFEVDYNMDKGAFILRWWVDACHGDIDLAIFRYNNGYKYNNRKYVPKVRKFYRGIGGVNEYPKCNH